MSKTPSIHAWFVLDLHDAHAVDSVRIVWGASAPPALNSRTGRKITRLTPERIRRENRWKSALSKSVAGSVSAYKVPSVRSRSLAVRFASQDLPSAGVQMANPAKRNALRNSGNAPKALYAETDPATRFRKRGLPVIFKRLMRCGAVA